jgi:hypothetical protein
MGEQMSPSTGAKREKVKRYYHEVETGQRIPADERLISALAEILRMRASDLLSWRPRPLGAAPGYFRADALPVIARLQPGSPVSGGYAFATVKLHSTGTFVMSSYGLVTQGSLQLCYSGNGTLPGALDVSGYVDTNGNGVQDAGEPTFSGTA